MSQPTTNCASCGGVISGGLDRCPYCGNEVASQPQGQGQNPWEQQQQQQQQQPQQQPWPQQGQPQPQPWPQQGQPQPQQPWPQQQPSQPQPMGYQPVQATPAPSGNKNLLIIMIAVAVLGVGGAIVPMALSQGSCSCGGTREPPIPLALGQTITGDISGSHSYRLYEIGITQPTQLNISVTSAYDNYLELYRGDAENPFMENDDGGAGLNAMINTLLQPDVYYILVRPYSDGSGPFSLTTVAQPVGQ